MKILDRSNVGCPMCSRIPVPSEEDLQWMHSGQPLISLMAEAFEEQKRKAREEAEQAAAPEKSEDSSQSALESMSQAMNDLEKLFGFDDSPESKIMTPSLSTSHIHSQIIGYSAANLIMSRIEQPDLNYRITYTETDLIYRESTQM